MNGARKESVREGCESRSLHHFSFFDEGRNMSRDTPFSFSRTKLSNFSSKPKASLLKMKRPEPDQQLIHSALDLKGYLGNTVKTTI